jgi:hypothetical protein
MRYSIFYGGGWRRGINSKSANLENHGDRWFIALTGQLVNWGSTGVGPSFDLELLDKPHKTRYIVAMCSWHTVNIRLQLSLAISMPN